MTVETFASADALALALADRVARAITAKPDIVLGLPAGRTPIALYRAIVASSHARHLDWSRVRTFNIDEFVSPAPPDESSQTFERFIHEHLLDLVNLEPSNIDRPNGRAFDLEAECARYERAIARAGGLDLLLLGIGANGHIGFNEPGSAPHDRTHIATLTGSTRQANAYLFGNDASLVPRRALTMGIGTLRDAREIVLVATGVEKAAPVAAMTQGPVTPQVPASLLRGHPRMIVMVDRPSHPT